MNSSARPFQLTHRFRLLGDRLIGCQITPIKAVGGFSLLMDQKRRKPSECRNLELTTGFNYRCRSLPRRTDLFIRTPLIH